MKSIRIFIISAIALLASVSCLRTEPDVFDKSASARLEEAFQNAQKVLTSQPNGWRLEYFPESTQCYGGYILMAKFNSDNTVTMASELKASDYRETSLYSFSKENGPVLTFDTYNDCIHFFADPGKGPRAGLGTLNGGLLGDFEFIVMEATPEKVILKGNKTGNKIYMTPATADWTKELDDYKTLVENYYAPGYICIYNNDTLKVVKPATYQGFESRRFDLTYTQVKEREELNQDTGVKELKRDTNLVVKPMGFIYTTKGVRFHEPYKILFYDALESRGGEDVFIEIEEMNFTETYYTDPKSGLRILGPDKVVSDNRISINVTESTFCTAKIEIATTNSDYYYLGYMEKSSFQQYSSVETLKKSIIKSLNDLVSASSVEDILANYCVSGNHEISFSDMKMNSSFVAVAMGIGVSNGCLVSSTDFYVQEFGTTDLPADATDNYQKWIGTWRITSTTSEESKTQKVFTVHIWPRVLNDRYFMSGFGIQAVKDDAGYEVETRLMSNGAYRMYHWNCTTKSMTNNPSTSIQFRLRFLTKATNAVSNYSSSSNHSLEFTMDDATNQVATGLGRESTTILLYSQVYWNVRSGSAYYYSAIAKECQYNTTSYKDFPVGPYKMEKLSDDINYNPSAASVSANGGELQLPHDLQIAINKLRAEEQLVLCEDETIEEM